jgi:Flp pilus assembly protein TadG
MMAFIGILGLVIDIGLGYARYRQMQTASDTAALAGTRELALGNGEAVAIQRIEQILTSNGADIRTSAYTINGNEVSVTAGLDINPVFTPIFGLDQLSVRAAANATFGQTAETNNLLPFAVEENLWLLDTEVNIWTGETGPGGNYGWVRWGGQSLSTSVLRANIENPSNSGTLRIGDEVPGKPGVSFSAVRASPNHRLGKPSMCFSTILKKLAAVVPTFGIPSLALANFALPILNRVVYTVLFEDTLFSR